MNHTPKCRKRFEEIFRSVKDPRMEAHDLKFPERRRKQLEEAEGERSQREQDAGPAASSSREIDESVEVEGQDDFMTVLLEVGPRFVCNLA